MDFRSYSAFREELDSTGILDLGNLSFRDSFPFDYPDRKSGHIGMKIHRCHLVENFLSVFDLNLEKRHIAVSNGVRHSLDLLMTEWRDRTWVIAEDQYPHYLQAANRAGVDYTGFSTNPNHEVSLPNGDVLLVCYPLKPWGVEPGDRAVQEVREWLAKDPSRKLIVDAVYSYNLKDVLFLDESFLKLFALGRIVILYSLAKTFNAPNTFGLVFSTDPTVREVFTKLERDDDRAEKAFILLNQLPGRREQLKEAVESKAARLNDLAIFTEVEFHCRGTIDYLFFLPGYDFEDLLSKGVLTVPNTVFGIEAEGVVVSTLTL